MTIDADVFIDGFLEDMEARASGVTAYSADAELPDIVEWAEENFYIWETGRPIQLEPHQKKILRMFTERRDDGRFVWTTCLYSTIKKSGKTTVSGMYGRWAAETWGPYQEVYNLGNKQDQAKDRAFKIAKRSIQLAPQEIQDQWDIQALSMTHLPSGSVIEALPISGEGEAGGNPSLTIWTELWGFQYPDALLMWEELTPVLTRPLSQRFIDTYAGFSGLSLLLESLWYAAKPESDPEKYRLDDELPIYGRPDMGLIAYIDQGKEARRMPWQQGDLGREYYARQKGSDSDSYRRHHLNEWESPRSQFIDMALWDRLEEAYPVERPDRLDVVLGVDGSVSVASTSLAVVTYDREMDKVVELETYIWEPPPGGVIDYDETLLPVMEALREKYRVICVAYDRTELHQTMTSLSKERTWRRVEFFAFPQTTLRVQADTALRERIVSGGLIHSGNPRVREHLVNADYKSTGSDDGAIRIVQRKRNDQNKRVKTKNIKNDIDAVVAISQAAWKAVEMLGKPEKKSGVRQAKVTGLWWSERQS